VIEVFTTRVGEMATSFSDEVPERVIMGLDLREWSSLRLQGKGNHNLAVNCSIRRATNSPRKGHARFQRLLPGNARLATNWDFNRS
jgi:hypothetical protein